MSDCPVPIPDLSNWPSLRKVYETGEESHDGREQKPLTAILSSPSLSTFENSPSTLLAAIDEFSYAEEFLISIGPHKAKILSDFVAEDKPEIIVELGGYLGYSAILFADAMRRTHGPDASGLHVYSLEMSPQFAAIATQLIDLAGLSKIVTVINLVRKKKLSEVDVLFLDHSEELYQQDFGIVEKLGLLNHGAVVIADNVVRPGAPEYRKMMRSKDGWTSEGLRGLIWPGELEDELEFSKFVGNIRTTQGTSV